MARAENAVLDSWQGLGELEEVIEPELEIVDPVSMRRGCTSCALHADPPSHCSTSLGPQTVAAQRARGLTRECSQHHHLWDWREPHVPGVNPGVNLDWE